MVELVSSKDRGGSSFALGRTWKNLKLPLQQTPTKSSFCECRAKVSSAFFKDIYEKDLKRLDKSRVLIKGLYVYAVDGDELSLPAPEDVLNQGYRGRKLANNLETHYPKMVTAQAVDVVNGMIKGFEFSATKGEYTVGLRLAAQMEKNSVTLYDRLYCAYEVVKNHTHVQNFFVIRVTEKKDAIQKDIRDFCRSSNRSQTIDLQPPRRLCKDLPIKVRLLKIKNPRTNETMVLMTNLSKSKFKDVELAQLYRRRWEIETSFRDLTTTLKMTLWRGKTINSILQEIYALLWLVNQVRSRSEALSGKEDWLASQYKKSNFKHLINIFLENVSLLCLRRFKAFHETFDYWARLTREKRCHLARSYERVIKTHRSKYTTASLINRRGP